MKCIDYFRVSLLLSWNHTLRAYIQECWWLCINQQRHQEPEGRAHGWPLVTDTWILRLLLTTYPAKHRDSSGFRSHLYLPPTVSTMRCYWVYIKKEILKMKDIYRNFEGWFELNRSLTYWASSLLKYICKWKWFVLIGCALLRK